MLQRFGVRVYAVVVAFSVAACGPGSDGEWIGMVTDSSGIEIVANPVSGLWRGGGGWEVEEELRIGTAEGDTLYQFGRIAGVDADSEGRIYVLDRQAGEVRVFDVDGEYVHTIGRSGEGPGELSEGAGALFIGRGDTLLIPDSRLQRVNRFLPDGSEVGSFPVPITEGVTVRWQMMPDGHLAQQVRTVALPGQDAEPEGDVVLLRGTDGAVRDTLLTLPVGESVQIRGGMPSFRFFGTEPTWTIDSYGRVVHGVNAEYNLRVREPGEGTVRMFRKPTARKRLTATDRTRILEMMRSEFIDRGGMPAEDWEAVRPSISFTDYYPVFHEVLGGPDGTLWVQHLMTAREVEQEGGELDVDALGSARWDIFDAEGRYLGVLELPERFYPFRVHHDHIYGVWRDELDVEYAVRLSIERLEEEDQGEESVTAAAGPTPATARVGTGSNGMITYSGRP